MPWWASKVTLSTQSHGSLDFKAHLTQHLTIKSQQHTTEGPKRFVTIRSLKGPSLVSKWYFENKYFQLPLLVSVEIPVNQLECEWLQCDTLMTYWRCSCGKFKNQSVQKNKLSARHLFHPFKKMFIKTI